MPELVGGSVTVGTSDVHVLFVNFNGLDPIDVRLLSSQSVNSDAVRALCMGIRSYMRGRLEHFDLPLHYRKLISSSLPAQHLLAGVLRERL